MESPTAEIIAIDERGALLRVESGIACARCAAGKGCGAGLLSTGGAPRELRIVLPEGSDFMPGERVRLTLRPARLLQASCIAYGLPLLAMTLMPLGANWLWGPLSDAQLAMLALGAVAGAVLAGRHLLRREQCLQQFVPGIAGRLAAGNS